MSDANFPFLFVALIVGVFVVWVVGGGPEQAAQRGAQEQSTSSALGLVVDNDNAAGATSWRDFVAAPSWRQGYSSSRNDGPLSRSEIRQDLFDAQSTLDETREQLEEAQIWGVVSPYRDKINISRNVSSVNTTRADEEYVLIRADFGNEESIDITGWQLESYVTGVKRTIGRGVSVPKTGSAQKTERIVLHPRDEAVIATWISPIGYSFRINKCTGYFEQYQNFTPRLQLSCPYPDDELDDFGNIAVTDDECFDYVDRLPQCEVVIEDLDDVQPKLTSSCKRFVEKELTYNSCVDNHRNDADFFDADEWRIFLESYGELWREEREIIKLLDREGRTVDVFSY